MVSYMNTKSVATVATFAALTIVLNLSPFKIPAPYAPYLIYQIWEIPIVAAFLLFGAALGVGITVLNTAILLIVFPGMLITGPLYNLAAVLSMLFGVFLAKVFVKRKQQKYGEPVEISLFTVTGAVFRVAIMTLVNWTFLRFPPPVGFSMPEEALLLSLPFIAVFNATLTLYTVPLGYLIAKAAKQSIKMPE